MGLKYRVRFSTSRFFSLNLYDIKLGSLKSLVTFGKIVDSEKGQEGLSFSVSFLRHLTELVLSTKQCPWRPVSTGGPTLDTSMSEGFQNGQRFRLSSKIHASLRPQEILCQRSGVSVLTERLP